MAAKRKNKKKAKPKRRRPVGAAAPQINTRRVLQRAYDVFHEDGDSERALELLRQVETQGPLSIQAADLYLDVLHKVRDVDNYARIAIDLAQRHPRDPDANMLAGSSSLATMQPISSILFFERFLELDPKHPGASDARKQVAKLRDRLPVILDAFVDDIPKDLPRIASVENILHSLKLGRFDDVIKRARVHLQTYPADIRIRNNWAEALAIKGELKDSLAVTDETLLAKPSNFFARVVRCRLLFSLGRVSESRTDADKVLTIQPRQISDLVKAAEAFAYTGDDAKVRWAFQEAKDCGWMGESPLDDALLLNFYATSLARGGEVKAAMRYWTRADKLASEKTPAGGNLDDVDAPVGDQWGPAFFGLADWLSRAQQIEFRDSISGVEHLDDDDEQSVVPGEFERAAKLFLSRYPQIEHILPAMLDRGDEMSQRFAMTVAIQSPNPELRSSLVSYVTGQRGADEARHQLLMKLQKNGHAFDSPVSIYNKGKQCNIEIHNFVIIDEPSVPEDRSDETSELIEDAYDALQLGDGDEAERIFQEVIKIEPNAPDVLNNLAAALQMQDRTDEADVLVDELIERFPDYFFAKIAAANRKIKQREFDGAARILRDLTQYDRFHTTEFAAMATSWVHLYAGKKEREQARHWLGMFEENVPDHQGIERLRWLIEAHENAGSLISRLLPSGMRKPRIR